MKTMIKRVDNPRFFVEAMPPAIDAAAPLELSTAEAHHAMNVLRLGTGQAVELFDGQGRSASGRIAQAKHGKVTVALEQMHQAQRRSEPVVHLAFAVPKAKRLDWLLEKATELGSASLWPVIFERSVAGGDELGPGKRQRWLVHCVAAAKQCGLDFLPEIHEPITIGELARQESHGAFRLVGDLSADVLPLGQALAARQVGQEVLLVVGPEGGMTPAELAMLHQAGFVSARLGQTTLRIETAALALLAGVLTAVQDQL